MINISSVSGLEPDVRLSLTDDVLFLLLVVALHFVAIFDKDVKQCLRVFVIEV